MQLLGLSEADIFCTLKQNLSVYVAGTIFVYENS